MTNYLLDTNALSEASKKSPNQGFMNWFTEVDEHALFTSCLVLGEIQKGIALCADPDKQDQFKALLADITESLEGRVIGVDTQVALLWGQLSADGCRSGKTPPAIDALIAAQCVAHDLVLVTRNIKDFTQFARLKLCSPWVL